MEHVHVGLTHYFSPTSGLRGIVGFHHPAWQTPVSRGRSGHCLHRGDHPFHIPSFFKGYFLSLFTISISLHCRYRSVTAVTLGILTVAVQGDAVDGRKRVARLCSVHAYTCERWRNLQIKGKPFTKLIKELEWCNVIHGSEISKYIPEGHNREVFLIIVIVKLYEGIENGI